MSNINRKNKPFRKNWIILKTYLLNITTYQLRTTYNSSPILDGLRGNLEQFEINIIDIVNEIYKIWKSNKNIMMNMIIQ